MSHAFTELVAGMLPPEARTALKPGTSAMLAAPYSHRQDQSAVVTGVVIRACPTTYNLTVKIGRSNVSCIMAGASATDLLGTSTAELPRVGAEVIVYLPTRNVAMGGIVLGAIPTHRRAEVVGSKNPKETSIFLPEINYESGTLIRYHAGYTGATAAKSLPQAGVGGGSKPADILPGDAANINAQQVGWYIKAFTAGILASQRAHITVSMLDDTVSVTGGTFKIIGPTGTRNAYNDNGHITDEESLTSYQAERAGQSVIGAPITDKDGKEGRFSSIIKNIVGRIVPRARLQVFKGYLGDIINIFVGSPDPTVGLPLTEGTRSTDRGLFHTHVDSSGRLHVRAANGIIFERSDCIPVPKRVRQPWDPKGDKQVEPQEKRDFEWNKEHPYGRSLLMRDASAWRTRQAYGRMMEHEKDIHIPEEGDLATPEALYDPIGKAIADYDSNAGRRAYAAIEPDGSIILRDAWGSEIIMRGGNIILNAAGNIEARAGKSVVNMGGQDIIMKARDSVDITAENHDVRVIARNNLHMRSEGVIVESTAQHTAVDTSAPEAAGEARRGGGIVFHAPNSRVLTNAKVVHVAGNQRIIMDTSGGTDGNSDDADDNKGTFQVLAGNVTVDARNSVRLGSKDNTSLRMGAGAVTIAAKSIATIASVSNQISQDGKALVPVMWVDIKHPPYPPLHTEMRANNAIVSDYATVLAGATPSERAKIGVTYRTAAQYGTESASEVGGGSKEFRLYQPAWEFLLLNGAQGLYGTTRPWMERDISGTYPWPGAGVRDKCYIRLAREVNVNTQNGKAINRKDMEVAGGDFEFDSIDTATAVL